jgi:hypothetical protein
MHKEPMDSLILSNTLIVKEHSARKSIEIMRRYFHGAEGKS